MTVTTVSAGERLYVYERSAGLLRLPCGFQIYLSEATFWRLCAAERQRAAKLSLNFSIHQEVSGETRDDSF